MAGLGDLVISLHADTAKFQSDMGRASHVAEKEFGKIVRNASIVGTALGHMLYDVGKFALRAGADFVSFAANLDDMAEKTGASVEELSKLAQQAHISGTSLESVETALIKLNKALNADDEESKKATRALGALGLKAEELKNLDPATAFRIIAVELNKFADGGGKSALALDLLGKSGAQALPILKDLANDTELSVNATAKQAAESEELGKTWRRLTNDAQNVGRAIALDLVPFLTDLIKEFRNTADGSGKLDTSFSPLRQSLRAIAIFAANVTFVLKGTGNEIGGLAAQLAAFGRGDFKAGLTIGKLMKDDAVQARKEFDALEARLMSLGKTASNLPDVANPGLDYKASTDTSGIKKAAKEAAELLKLYEEVKRIGASIDVSVLPIKGKDFQDTKEQLEKIKKTLEEGRKGWIAYADAVFAEAEAIDRANASGESFTQFAEKLTEKTLDAADSTRAWVRELENLKMLQGTYLSAEQFNKAVSENPLRKKYVDLIDPIQKYRIQLEEVQRLEELGIERGGLSAAQATEAIFKINEQIDAVSGLNVKIKEADDSAKDFGHAISTAFEDAIIGGKKAIDVVTALGKTIAQIILRQTVTKPLESAIGDALSGAGGLGGLFKNLFSGFGGGTTQTAPYFGPVASGIQSVPSDGFAFLHQGEQVVPAGENSRGVTIVNNNDFRGVDASVVAQIERKLVIVERTTVARVENARRRSRL